MLMYSKYTKSKVAKSDSAVTHVYFSTLLDAINGFNSLHTCTYDIVQDYYKLLNLHITLYNFKRQTNMLISSLSVEDTVLKSTNKPQNYA